ncbi:DivIVA domain-containing protein [Microbacterium sp. NPDC055683]
MTDSSAPTPFPLVTGRQKGYERSAVDAFLAAAREAFEQGAEHVDAEVVRAAAFPLVRGGYAVMPVDAALARIEDAFAAREREHAIREQGAAAWVDAARRDAQDVLDRLRRPEGERFDRVGLLRFGYARAEVDLVADRIAAYLADGAALTPEQVRQTAFRMARNGYREEQVDAVLDAVVGVMLAVR